MVHVSHSYSPAEVPFLISFSGTEGVLSSSCAEVDPTLVGFKSWRPTTLAISRWIWVVPLESIQPLKLVVHHHHKWGLFMVTGTINDQPFTLERNKERRCANCWRGACTADEAMNHVSIMRMSGNSFLCLGRVDEQAFSCGIWIWGRHVINQTAQKSLDPYQFFSLDNRD